MRDLSKTPTLPDEIWTRLKTWAKAQAASPLEPSFNECENYVRRVCLEITGAPNALRPDVVAFYASEARELATKFRTARDAEGGVA